MLLRRALAVVLLLSLAAVAARAQEPGPGYWDRTPLPQQGLATFYARGMMEYVYDYRARQGDISGCPECVGTVALLRAGDIGRRIWLQPPGGDPVGPFLVIDCARRQDVQPLLNRNWVVDISYELGQMWGMKGPLDGVLVFEDPADAASVPEGSPRGRPTRFYVDPGTVIISQPTVTPDPAFAAAQGLPTSWPTRQPSPLPGVIVPPTQVNAEAPEEAAPPAATPGPPPLTPIVTTPTPQWTATPPATATPPELATAGPASTTPQPAAIAEPGGSGAVAGEGASLVEALPPPTATPEPEVSIGGAGGGLLTGGSLSPFDSGLATPTRIRPPRTPRPDLTPFLPQATPRPSPTPEPKPEDSFWDRILREIRDLLN